MHDFPAVRAAMAERVPAFDACRALGFQPGFDRRAERAEWKRLHDAADAAYDRVLAAYANEMLPAILGGAWKHTERTLWVSAGYTGLGGGRPRTYVADELGRSLMDHRLHFRRTEAPRGKLTAANCALIGQPYLSKRGPDGARGRLSIRDAAALAGLGFGIWARDDLSAWYPGWTVLVLAAQGLRPEAAASFGFTALEPMADVQAA